MPEEQKKLALAKYDLIKKWEEYKNKSKNKTIAGKEFLEIYNNQLLYQELFKIIGRVAIGTIYKLDGTTLCLKDVVSYNLDANSWEEISEDDRTLNATADASCVIIKNNEIVDDSVFRVGDKIRVMGMEDGYTVKKSNGTYTGYIIFVER